MQGNRRLTFFAAVCCVVAGCDEANEPTSQDYDDVAKSVGTMVSNQGGGGDVDAVVDSIDLSAGLTPLGFSVNTSGQIHGSRFGLAYDYASTCLDAQGATLEHCGPSAASARVDVGWSGQLDFASFDIDVERTGEWTVTGLQSDVSTVNGQGSFELDATFQDANDTAASREVHFSYAADYSNILVENDLPHHVVGGTIQYDVAGSRRAADGMGASDFSYHVSAVVTFAADGHATLVLDGTRTYDVNATTGEVTLHADFQD